MEELGFSLVEAEINRERVLQSWQLWFLKKAFKIWGEEEKKKNVQNVLLLSFHLSKGIVSTEKEEPHCLHHLLYLI